MFSAGKAILSVIICVATMVSVYIILGFKWGIITFCVGAIIALVFIVAAKLKNNSKN